MVLRLHHRPEPAPKAAVTGHSHPESRADQPKLKKGRHYYSEKKVVRLAKRKRTVQLNQDGGNRFGWIMIERHLILELSDPDCFVLTDGDVVASGRRGANTLHKAAAEHGGTEAQ